MSILSRILPKFSFSKKDERQDQELVRGPIDTSNDYDYKREFYRIVKYHSGNGKVYLVPMKFNYAKQSLYKKYKIEFYDSEVFDDEFACKDKCVSLNIKDIKSDNVVEAAKLASFIANLDNMRSALSRMIEDIERAEHHKETINIAVEHIFKEYAKDIEISDFNPDTGNIYLIVKDLDIKFSINIDFTDCDRIAIDMYWSEPEDNRRISHSFTVIRSLVDFGNLLETFKAFKGIKE